MARVVGPTGFLSAPAPIHTDFYRQEFMKHRECLAAQREVLFRAGDHGRRRSARARPQSARAAVREGRRRSSDRRAVAEVQCDHRPVGLVRSNPVALTFPLQRLREHTSEILRGAVAAADPARLLRAAQARGAIDRLRSFIGCRATSPGGRGRQSGMARRPCICRARSWCDQQGADRRTACGCRAAASSIRVA